VGELQFKVTDLLTHKNVKIMSDEMMNYNGVTPYEAFKMSEMSRKGKVNGVGITGLVLGSVGLAAALTGWVYANGQAKKAQEVATAQNNGTNALLNQMANLLAEERRERVNGDITLNATINDTVSGQQASNLTAQQQAELAASQVATQTVMTGLMTGEYQAAPKRVSIWQEGPCGCPATGCGCNN